MFTFCSIGQNVNSLMNVWQNKTASDSDRITALYDVCWKLVFSDADSAIRLSNEGIEFAQKMNSTPDIVNLYNAMGVASTLKGEYFQAIDYYEKAIIRASNDLDSKKNSVREAARACLAQTYINRGILYKNQGNYPKALENQLQSLRMWEVLDRRDKMAVSYGNIGVIYKHLGQFDKALSFQRKCLKIDLALKNIDRQATTYSNIGNLYKAKGDVDSAMIYQKISLQFSIETQNKIGQINAYGNIGNLYYILGETRKAIENQEIGLEIALETGSKKRISSAYVDLGQYYLKLRKYSQSKLYLSKSLLLAEEIGSVKEQKFAHEWLSKLFSETGEFQLSLDHYKDFITLRDSLISENTHRDVDRAELNSEFEKRNYADSINRDVKARIIKVERDREAEAKEAELANEKRFAFIATIGSILLLALLIVVIAQVVKQKKNNVLLNLQKAKIEKSDKEKEVLIREIHHRVKNNLQIISSLLKSEQRKSTSDEVKGALAYSRQRIEAISFVHEKLYLQTDLTNVDLEDYLLDLAENLLFSYDKHKEIKLAVNSRVRNLHADVAVNLGLLTAELITNSIKHGQKSDSEDFIISVDLTTKENDIEFAYRDNGVGDNGGSGIKIGTSFGMKLVRSIIKKMNGEIVENSENSKGFLLTFYFTNRTNE